MARPHKAIETQRLQFDFAEHIVKKIDEQMRKISAVTRVETVRRSILLTDALLDDKVERITIRRKDKSEEVVLLVV